jgi:hypothetical protein
VSVHDQPPTEHQPVPTRSALWRGAGSLLISLLLATAFSFFLEKGFQVNKAWLWVDLFRNPPSLAKVQDTKAFEANLDRLFQIIFVVAVFVSVFAQQTISYFFRLNKFDLYSSLVFKLPAFIRGQDGKRHISVRRYGKPVQAEKLLKLTIIIVALNVIASASIVAVGNFAFHVVTTMIYLAVVLGLDLVTWLFIDESHCDIVYRGIRPYRLFRYMNRQLIFTIDSGMAVIFIIIALGAMGGYANDTTVTEKAFFTGVVSFYLISTCILIGYLLYEWGAILNRKSVIDLDQLPNISKLLG